MIAASVPVLTVVTLLSLGVTSPFFKASMSATADEILDNATTFVSELAEDLAPEQGRGPSYKVVSYENDSIPYGPGLDNKTIQRAKEILHDVDASVHQVLFAVIILLFVFGAGMVYCQLKIVRDMNRLRRVIERRIPPPPPPQDVENPRQEPDLESQRSDHSRSDQEPPPQNPTTEPEIQEEEEEEQAGPPPPGPSRLRGTNRRGDEPDESTGKTLVSEVMEVVEQKEHDDPESEDVRSGSSETCEVDKGKLERVGEPSQSGKQRPSHAIPGTSSGISREHEKESKFTSTESVSARRASNGAPSPRKKSQTPSPTKQKEIAPGRSTFEIAE